MQRVLITGMSGTGKSTVIQMLTARGHRAVDLDSEQWSHWIPVPGADPLDPPAEPGSPWQNRDWVWREDRVAHLLAEEGDGTLFAAGTAANQGRFHRYFDHIILLSAPADVLAERLRSRAGNEYGKRPEELARVLHHIETVEPLLRRAASREIDTSRPLDEVVRLIEHMAR